MTSSLSEHSSERARLLPGPVLREAWAVAAIAAAVSLPGLSGLELHFDEIGSLEAAARPLDPRAAGSLWALLGGGDPHPPLYYVLLSGWLALVPAPWAARLPSVAAAAASVAILFRMVAARWGRQVAWGAALLLAVCPLHWQHARQARMYPLAELALVAALAAVARARWRDEAPGAAAWGWSALAIHLHYLSAVPVAAMAGLVLATRPRPALRSFWPLLLIAPLIPLVLWQLGQAGWAVPWKPAVSLASPYHVLKNLAAGYRELANVPGEGPIEPARHAAALLAGLLLCAGAWREGRPRVVTPFLGITIAALLAGGTLRTFWNARYAVLQAPAFAALVAFGAWGAPRQEDRRGPAPGPLAGSALVGLSALLAIWLSVVDPPAPWARAARVVDEVAGRNVPVVVFLPDRLRMLRHHLGARPNLHAVWPSELPDGLEAVVANHDRIVLVAYHPQVMDPQGRFLRQIREQFTTLRESTDLGPIHVLELARRAPGLSPPNP